MSTYYLNAGSVTQDGLAASTGYHNFTALLASITLVNNDVIEIVDNGIIDDNSASISISTAITIMSYNGDSDLPTNINKPTVKVSFLPGQPGIYFEGTNDIIINDINFKNDRGAFIRITNTDITGATKSYIERCTFDHVYINSSACSIVNNIFSNLGSYAIFAQRGCLFVNNNTFYNNFSAVFVNQATEVKILNNIFHTGTYCVYFVQELVIAALIDYNIDYMHASNVEVKYRVFNPSFIGTHNIFDTNPELTNPSSGNFTLQPYSPCVNVGIGHNVEGDHEAEPLIPIIDFVSNTRPYGTYTDIGAYELQSDPVAPLVTYYVNAGASTEDGLTPETGYNKISTLLANLDVKDNDTIEIVEFGGEVVENADFVVNKSITIKSYEEAVLKPTVQIIKMSLLGNINLYDINFKLDIVDGEGIDTGAYNYDISRCTFKGDTTSPYIHGVIGNSNVLSITNCIFECFTGTEGSFDKFLKLSGYQVFINNNVFYNNTEFRGNCFIDLESSTIVSGSKILNNIFYFTTYAVKGPNNSNIIADFNCDSSVTTPYYQIDIGTNNLNSTDAHFVRVVNEDFHLNFDSPCIETGIGHSIEGTRSAEPSVPTIDFDGNARPYGTHTDIGAYEWVESSTTTTTTTTTPAPITTTTTTTTPAPIDPNDNMSIWVYGCAWSGSTWLSDPTAALAAVNTAFSTVANLTFTTIQIVSSLTSFGTGMAFAVVEPIYKGRKYLDPNDLSALRTAIQIALQTGSTYPSLTFNDIVFGANKKSTL